MVNSFKKSVAFVLLAAVAAWAAPSAPPQDAKTVLSNASKAMGADNLKTIQYSGTGTEFAFGQAYNPDSPWPPFADKSYTRTIDYETPAWRVDRVLDAIPPDRRGGGLPPGPTQNVVIGAEYAVGHAGGPVDDPLRFLARSHEERRHGLVQVHGREEILRRDFHRAQ